jgi:hypothetical protein
MAQTTTAQSGAAGLVEFSTNGSSWTDISGSIKMVDPGEGTRQSGEDFTLSGDYAIITGGKFSPLEISATGLWTPTSGEAFAVVEAAYIAKSSGYIRWSPQGGSSGQKRYTSDAGVITGFLWPKVDASDAKPVPAGFKLKTPKITESTIP